MQNNNNKQAGFAVSHALIAVALLIGVTTASRYVLDSHRTNTKILQTNETSGLLIQSAAMLIAESADGDNDGFREAPAFTADPAAPAGGGIVPITSGAPKTDARGRSLGYCAWDNGSTNSSVGRITGDNPGSAASISVAVLSPGDNGTFEMSCGDAALNNRLGDDKSVRYTAGQVSQGVLSNVHWGTPVLDAAERDGLDPGALTDGEVRLVESENNLYRWDATGSAWAEVSAGVWTDEGGWISYSDALSGAIVATGTTGVGSTPVSGAGTRMMWLPHKSAFRAGAVDGAQWDEASVGAYSGALGRNVTASGDAGFAFGDSSRAVGSQALAAGYVARADGLRSVALGMGVTASGTNSMALVADSSASGARSLAAGNRVAATGGDSVVFGRGFDASNLLVNGVADSFMVGYMSSALDTMPEFLVRDGGVAVNGTTLVESLTNNGRLALAETTAPAATAGYGKLYVDSADSKLYFMDDAGAQISLSDAVTGSGTAGYLPKFTDVSTVADSLIYDDGVFVGIGTAAPTANLHVSAGAGNTVVLADALDTTLGTKSQFSARTATGELVVGMVEGGSAASSYGVVGTSTASPLVFQVAGSEVARFSANGQLGLGTNNPLATLHVESGQILAVGTHNAAATGFVPVSDTGTRLMWLPERSAFRAGYAIDDDWNEANVGEYSATFGRGSRAGGWASFAAGDSVDASGGQSAAFGYNVTVSGGRSFGVGIGSVASGSTSFVAGRNLTASGDYSYAFGYGFDDVNRFTNSTAQSFAVGFMNATTDTTPDFIVKDNAVGIRTSNPLAALHVGGGQVLMQGTYSGTLTSTPTTGAGSRLMWLPSVAAFRAGRAIGTEWDTASIGLYSTGLGYSPTASGAASLALGETPVASGNGSVALGSFPIASGLNSIAIGRHVSATNNRNIMVGRGFSSTEYMTNNVTDSFAVGFITATGGSTTPELMVRDGSVILNGTSPQAGYFLTVYGSAYASGGVWDPSDRRFKKNIEGITGALSLIKNVRAVRYNYRTDEYKDRHFDDKRHIGFIAQELKELFPELVKEDAAGFLAVDYGALTPVLAGAIQEQQIQIETIDERLKLAERGVELADNPFSSNPDDKIELGSVKTDEQVLMERGTAQLKSGVARIELPKTFNAITHSHTVSAYLTPEHDAKGRAALTYEYDNGVLVVRDESGANPAQRFSWQVMAERKDVQRLRANVKMADLYRQPAEFEKVPEW